ncbi:MAG: NADH-quinone oxidoreductase subunit NuoI [Truepera sp.]|jgi:NADH-quinone oxidoreductase subunit I|nr:NADH-quinone oxidoreductase subunit NuoI [Truepera sp.]
MSVIDIAKGMGLTLGYLFKRPVTVQYPRDKIVMQARFRGRHHLLRHPDTDLEKCIGCSLCAAACPTYCIYVEAAENDPDDPVSPGERYAKIYEINMLRCIFCGFCEEACPTGAVVLGHEFELADFKYEDFVYRKEDMLVGTKGSKWQRREAEAKDKDVRLGFNADHRAELEGVDY